MKGLMLALGRGLLRLRYAIRVRGLAPVRDRGRKGILFLPNHPALIDPLILLGELWRNFRPWSLADRDLLDRPGFGVLGRWFQAIPMSDPARYGVDAREDVEQALERLARILAEGGNVVVYPTGRLQQGSVETVGGNSAVQTLLARVPDCRVVLVRTRGLWGSRFSLAGAEGSLLRGFWTTGVDIFKSFLLFAPRRVVTLDVLEPADFPRKGSRWEQNTFLEAYFNDGSPHPTYVPHTLWEKGGLRPLPHPVEVPRVLSRSDVSVPERIRIVVLQQLTRMTGQTGISDDMQMARDLGLDSLARLELALWVERTFQVVRPEEESLQTVADLLLAAAGEPLETPRTVVPPPPAWFSHRPLTPMIPAGETLLEVFLGQVERGPNRPAVADQTTGMKTYGELLTGICVLAPVLARLEGTHVGLMLPASAGGGLLYLALVAAGKVPVLVNWTVGSRNLAHALESLDVRHVVTSKVLVERLKNRGVDLSCVGDRLLTVEQMRRSLGLRDKVYGALMARFAPRQLLARPLPETAAVLFTSGSETLPKGVPLTHANLLANIRDLQDVVIFRAGDRLLGFLPPFHSFGLTCNVLLPLLGGIPLACHPNPTEGAALARTLEVYRCSVIASTPTFLATMLRAARDEQLQTLRSVVSGAERCPEALFDSLARRFPWMEVLEGYGITECSPVVSANREGRSRRGTIGWLMPSLEALVVHPETHEPVEKGERGLLLLRGPSVFGGYLCGASNPFVEAAGKPWYNTGDLVRFDATDALVFAGRLKRFVKIGGEMVSLPAVEEALLAKVPAEGDIVPLAVEAAEGEGRPELVLCTTVELGMEEANAILKEAGFSPLQFIRRVVRLSTMPLLGNGKVDYRTLKEKLQIA